SRPEAARRRPGPAESRAGETQGSIARDMSRARDRRVLLTMKVIWSTTDPAEASVFSALLREAGIPSSTENEGGALYAVGMPTSAVPLNIAVREADAERAQNLLRDFVHRKRSGDDAFKRSVETSRRRWLWFFI